MAMMETHTQPSPDIAAVVVTFNRKALLLQCLHCLLQQEGAVCDILVVDNASADGTEEAVLPLLGDRVHYMRLNQNLGGAGGFHMGMRKALEMGYRRLWLMDDDTQPRPDALQALLEAEIIAPADYGCLSSVALWTDGSPCRMNRQKLRKETAADSRTGKNGMARISQATFVSLFLRAETVRSVGLPIREFFIWGDDIEYTRRIAVRRKMPSYRVENSRVVHAMPANTGSSIAFDSPERFGRYAMAFRNENFTYRQEGLKGFIYYSAKCGLNIARVLLKAKDQRTRRIMIILRAYVGGLLFNPKIEPAPGATKAS